MRFAVVTFLFTGLIAVPSLARANMTVSDVNPDGVKSRYVQSTTIASTSSTTPVLVPGMQLTLPAKGRSAKFALVTFSAPTLVPNGLCLFGIYAASTQYAAGESSSGGATPITIVTKIPLQTATQPLEVKWNSFEPSSTCFIGYPSPALPAFYSLTVILSAD